MFMSSALIGAALITFQADPVRAPREAFANCLRQFVNSSLEGRKTVEAFTAEFAQQCSAQEQAYRDAMVRRDVAPPTRMSQADATEAANEEIEYTRTQSRESFADASAPQT